MSAIATFTDLLSKYRSEAFSKVDQGKRFERLMQRYLLTDPVYKGIFTEVWLWENFFGRLELGGHDTGIDLVAQTHSGQYWAIQCKCYLENAYIDLKDVGTFLASSGRTFHTKEGQKTHFAHRLYIATTNNWSSHAENAIKGQHPEVNRINLSDLQSASVNWQKLEQGAHGDTARLEPKQPRDYQKEAITKAHEHYKLSDRGKMIMACGTGKTFTALRIVENELLGARDREHEGTGGRVQGTANNDAAEPPQSLTPTPRVIVYPSIPIRLDSA